MMSRNKIINITLSFVLLLQAAFFQVALPNLVLCFGSDGHISFEWQFEKRLCSQENLVDSIIFSNSENKYAGTPEADCTDVYLHFHPSFAYKNHKKNFLIFVDLTLFLNYTSDTENTILII